MNNRKYLLYIQIIKLFLYYLLVFAVIGTILKLLDHNINLTLQFFFLLPAPYLCMIIQKHTRHMLSFFFLHLVIIGGYIVLTPLKIRLFFYLPYLIALMIMNLKERLIEEERPAANISIFPALIFVFLSFVSKYFKLTELPSYLFCFLIVYILLFLVNMYLVNFEKFFRTHAALTNVPIQKIKSTNHTLVLFFTSLSLGAMLLFQYFPIKELIGLLGKSILAFLKAIGAFLQHFGKSEQVEQVKNTEQSIDYSAFMDKENIPSPIVEFLQKLITGLITFGIFALLIALIIYSLYKLYKSFYEKKYTFLTDKTEFISPFDKSENLDFHPVKTLFKKFLPVYGMAPGDRIRKLYFKAVSLNADSEEIKTSMTPKELTKLALSEPKEHILFADTSKESDKVLYSNGVDSFTDSINADSPDKKLTYYYEKARYGKEVCSKEDLQVVKNLLHRIK